MFCWLWRKSQGGQIRFKVRGKNPIEILLPATCNLAEKVGTKFVCYDAMQARSRAVLRIVAP